MKVHLPPRLCVLGLLFFLELFSCYLPDSSLLDLIRLSVKRERVLSTVNQSLGT